MYYNYSDLNYINQELAVVWPGWTAVKLLGRGGFGAVYEIHRNIRGNLEKAAMKVLRVPDSDAEVARLQFQGMNYQNTEAYYEKLVDGIYNEIRIMQSFVGYSHIVSYEDYAIRKRNGEIGWDIYIRMELLTSLPDYMSRHPMNDQMVFKLGMDIAQGLSDCHNKGVIHRDVKPENIFVNEAGNFKLGDFGVSRNVLGSQDVLSFKGTLAYMAPEVFRMASTDARSDIYSLGMVLYQCLNDNRLPFVPSKFSPYDIETARQRRLAGEPIPAPVHGSNNLKSIVLKALAVRPEYRFQTAEEMYRALRQAYEADYNESVTLYQNTQFQQPVKKPFPLIPIVATMAVVLTVIAGAGIFSLFIRKGDNSGTGQAAQADVTVQSEQISQNDDEQPVEETQEVDANYAIDWKDAALEAKMREITGISSGDIMYSDVKDITELDLSNPYETTDDNVMIRDISALSSLTNLTELSLYGNLINDISALSGLTNLDLLRLDYNQVSDISVLSNLTNLTKLSMWGNQISDISVLSGLTNLEILGLGFNQISDISALSGLTNLVELHLIKNQIGDISVLSNLKNLTTLDLSGNQISDINVLSGLTNLNKLSLSYSQLSDISILSNLKNLTMLELSGNQISDINVLSGLTNLEILWLDNNQISDISALDGLMDLRTLRLDYNQISDISTLSGLTNLVKLWLCENQISDINVLGGLTNLTSLDLSFNQVSDISALSGLTNLTELDLGKNQISDISALSGLTNLTELDLWANQISDISALSGLTYLTELNLWNNQISDISALRNLTNLTYLDISNNPISDYSPIEDLNIEKLSK